MVRPGEIWNPGYGKIVIDAAVALVLPFDFRCYVQTEVEVNENTHYLKQVLDILDSTIALKEIIRDCRGKVYRILYHDTRFGFRTILFRRKKNNIFTITTPYRVDDTFTIPFCANNHFTILCRAVACRDCWAARVLYSWNIRTMLSVNTKVVHLPNRAQYFRSYKASDRI